MSHQTLGNSQHDRLRLSSSTTSRSNSPDVVFVQSLRRLQRPHRALPVVQTAKVLRHRLAVDHDLSSTLYDVNGCRAALSPSCCPSAAVLIDNDRLGLVVERLQSTLEAVQSCGHLFGCHSRMNQVQTLDNRHQAAVSRLFDRLVQLSLVLLPCLPCYFRRFGSGKLGQQLMSAEKVGEVEVIVGKARNCGEVAGRIRDNAYPLE